MFVVGPGLEGKFFGKNLLLFQPSLHHVKYTKGHRFGAGKKMNHIVM
jgi:hypothetical protein